ncbi:MAG: hypothetical protein RIQ62_548 [Bacteroidota bacterium]|jgi:hypothetical protein
MKPNVGTVDKIIRIAIAIIIAILFFTGSITGTTGIILFVLALVFLLTAIVNFCPLYSIIGLSTNKSTKE